MMDKNTVIGMLLMCAVIFGFMYFQPKDENAQNKQQAQTTEKTANNAASNASVDTLTAAEMTLLDTLTAKNGEITMPGVGMAPGCRTSPQGDPPERKETSSCGSTS